MRDCPSCGFSNPPEADSCASCGSSLTEARPSLDEARKTVTVLFCDLVGSTTLGDRLDPESLRRVMVRFFGEMRGVLERHGGSVEKYIGDAVMAVFGVPRLHEDDALRAVRAAGEMHAALERLNEELDRRWGVRLQMRIGVNTGEVVVGDVSAGEAMVLGDAVNVAARLEQSAPVGQTVIGAETYALVRDHADVEPAGALSLKGKPEPVHAYRLLAARSIEVIAARPQPPLVGRDDELAGLRREFERSVANRDAVLMTIMGSAGIGKSRLSRELIDRLGDGAMVLMTRCLPYGDAITFWPMADVVKQACGIVDEDTRAGVRAKIDAAVAGADDERLIAGRIAGVLGVDGDPGELQETFWAVRRFLEWLARERPVVLVVDDLQWAEPTLLDLIEYLAGWTRDAPLFLLCLARPDLLDTRPSWGGAAAGSGWLSLAPLDQDESHVLIRSLLGGPGIAESMVDRIADSAGGNALFLEEMLRMLEDDGLLRRQDERWVVAGDLSEITVPASIHALLGSRLDRLTGAERAVIRCASVIGKVFWWGAVAELLPDEIRPQAGGHLQALVRKDLIRPDPSTFAGEDGFAFHHILLQEAAYRSTPKELRAELHARLAGWIARAAGGRAAEFDEVIGFHLEQAHRYRAALGEGEDVLVALGQRAARALASAGRRALERRDVAAATDVLRRAIALSPPDDEERPAILLGLGEALAETGDLSEAEASLDEAERLARAAGREAMVANAGVLRLYLFQSTDPQRLSEDAEKTAHELIGALEEIGDDAGLARAWRLVADLHWARSSYAAADEALARAVRHARKAGDAREEAECLGRYVGSGAYGPADVGEVERRCAELLATAGGLAGREAPALRALAVVRAMKGRFDEARALAGRARAALEEFGFRLRASWVSETLGAVEMLAGDPAAAERALRVGFDAAVEMGEQGFQATVAALLAHALVQQGRVEEADRFSAASASAAALDDIASQVLWRSARARVLAASGDPEEAEEVAREALAFVEQTDDINMHADTLVDLSEVVAGAGRPSEAAAALERAIELYDRKGNDVAAGAARTRLGALPD